MSQIKHPSFCITLVFTPLVVIVVVVIVLLSVDAVICVAARSSGSGRDGDGSFGVGVGVGVSSTSSAPPPSLAQRVNTASRNLRRDTLSFLQFLSPSLSINNINGDDGGDDDDDDALLFQFHHYYSKPPHDRRLYEILGVSSNATLNEIKKAWRRLSRMYHPDKILPAMAAAAAAARKRRNAEQNNNNNGASTASDDDDNQQSVDHAGDEEEDRQEKEERARQKLAEITHAYEILSDNRTRLLYHKYGLVGGCDAAIRLLRQSTISKQSDATPTTAATSTAASENKEEEEHRRLLELMGYPGASTIPEHTSTQSSSPPPPSQHHQSINKQSQQHHQQQRIHYLITTITERLRPIIEGTISQETFIDTIHEECNALKYSPLGAQILRCIGRAYLAEGHRALRRKRRRSGTIGSSPSLRHYHHHRPHHHRRRHHRHHQHFPEKKTGSQPEVVVDTAIDMWYDVKQYALAALASSKLIMMERKINKMEEEHLRTGTDCTAGSHVHPRHDDKFDREMKHNQKQKLHEALLAAHQIEALWKLSKIELYQIVRQACRRIVEEPNLIDGDYDVRRRRYHWHANFPSWGGHQQSPTVDDWRKNNLPPPPPPPPSSRHEHHHIHHLKINDSRLNTRDRIPEYAGEVGRLRAAAAMILVGDIMVQSSTNETAWSKT
ncbi:hypothetical protein ACHAWU_006764 [Discostella pseudostelligera]|uniref:J domain-containing protein n=1 Tax=Discostella pseudostelligera TaxID=259834 RepID=A0ABD3M0P5_9STRA